MNLNLSIFTTMKRIAIIFLACTACFLLGCFAAGFYFKNVTFKEYKNRQRNEEASLYKFTDARSKDFIIPFEASKENGFVPSNDVYELSNGAIPDAKTAAKVGTYILSSIYGYENVKRETPFTIQSLYDKVWLLTGALNKEHKEDALYVYIQKSDGRILDLGRLE